MLKRKAVLIAGPTASGKSALALERAERTGGLIVNADSMQVYDVLDILTARPPPGDLARASHRLYGFVPPAERCSVGRWLSAVAELVADPAVRGRELILVGGTGLFFEALENGIADIPDIPFAAAAEAELLVAPLDRVGRQALLAERDPEMAAILKEPDPQRLIRALSVLSVTGRSLAYWQKQVTLPPLQDFVIERQLVEVDRDTLARRIEARFRSMLEKGAVAEVGRLMALGLDPDLPAMKAIGVREIAAWQVGQIGREEAIARTTVATRQYAKRQRTWFRHHMAGWPRISPE